MNTKDNSYDALQKRHSLSASVHKECHSTLKTRNLVAPKEQGRLVRVAISSCLIALTLGLNSGTSALAMVASGGASTGSTSASSTQLPATQITQDQFNASNPAYRNFYNVNIVPGSSTSPTTTAPAVPVQTQMTAAPPTPIVTPTVVQPMAVIQTVSPPVLPSMAPLPPAIMAPTQSIQQTAAAVQSVGQVATQGVQSVMQTVPAILPVIAPTVAAPAPITAIVAPTQSIPTTPNLQASAFPTSAVPSIQAPATALQSIPQGAQTALQSIPAVINQQSNAVPAMNHDAQALSTVLQASQPSVNTMQNLDGTLVGRPKPAPTALSGNGVAESNTISLAALPMQSTDIEIKQTSSSKKWTGRGGGKGAGAAAGSDLTQKFNQAVSEYGDILKTILASSNSWEGKCTVKGYEGMTVEQAATKFIQQTYISFMSKDGLKMQNRDWQWSAFRNVMTSKYLHYNKETLAYSLIDHQNKMYKKVFDAKNGKPYDGTKWEAIFGDLENGNSKVGEAHHDVKYDSEKKTITLTVSSEKVSNELITVTFEGVESARVDQLSSGLSVTSGKVVLEPRGKSRNSFSTITAKTAVENGFDVIKIEYKMQNGTTDKRTYFLK